jgi:hypothetical protein
VDISVAFLDMLFVLCSPVITKRAIMGQGEGLVVYDNDWVLLTRFLLSKIFL